MFRLLVLFPLKLTFFTPPQERQDAVTDLVQNPTEKLDFVLVVGGFDSSNTAHLKEIPEKFGEQNVGLQTQTIL
jgi:4-hydroxy-3-methylbut-2-enyl diphosphate reductase IspH